MPAVPLISIQGPSSACTVGRGTVQKAEWLGGGPAFSLACWEMGSLHKEFPNKRHQYYLWSHQTAWGTIWLWLGHMLCPQVLCEAWPLNANMLEGLPLPPLSPVQSLFRLSLSRLDNGWTLNWQWVCPGVGHGQRVNGQTVGQS